MSNRKQHDLMKDFRRGISGLIVLSIIIGVLAGYLLALLLTAGACS